MRKKNVSISTMQVENMCACVRGLAHGVTNIEPGREQFCFGETAGTEIQSDSHIVRTKGSFKSETFLCYV